MPRVKEITYQKPVVIPVMLLILGLAAVLQQDVSGRHLFLFLIATGLGISLFHAAFGFAGGWRQFVRERRSAPIRAQLLLIALVSIVFFPLLAGAFPDLRFHGAYAPVGVSVLTGAFLFGIGMQLGGGCGSGTLFTVGGGHVRMLITLSFFVVGAVVGSVHLPWWLELPALGRISLLDSVGWPGALLLQLLLLAVLFRLVMKFEFSRFGAVEPITATKKKRSPLQRVMLGPWPVLWGALSLALLSLATLLVAGHPWSITFAFGLWGTKIWSALGGDISNWTYWSGGYPALALQRSVLADVTSVMNFGIILGAVLAAGLAGRFAPADPIRGRDLLTAIVGGFLLGYGARLAFGCNIGGLLAGMASGSLHGWLWLVGGFIGTMLGVQLRTRFGIDPPVEEHH